MRITLELTEPQATVFQDILDTSLKALVFQETQCLHALDDDLSIDHLGQVNDFMSKVKSQRILVAEILATVNAAEKKTQIITQ